MKQISARQFRTTFGSLTEPVAVVRREPDGEYVLLGAWTPASAKLDKGSLPNRKPTLMERMGGPVRFTSGPEEPPVTGFGISRPAPKPKR